MSSRVITRAHAPYFTDSPSSNSSSDSTTASGIESALEKAVWSSRVHVLAGQVENEFDFVGPNEKYMRHLVGTVRASLGDDVLIYTTDPPPNIAKGSLPGDEVLRWQTLLRSIS